MFFRAKKGKMGERRKESEKELDGAIDRLTDGDIHRKLSMLVVR